MKSSRNGIQRNNQTPSDAECRKDERNWLSLGHCRPMPWGRLWVDIPDRIEPQPDADETVRCLYVVAQMCTGSTLRGPITLDRLAPVLRKADAHQRESLDVATDGGRCVSLAARSVGNTTVSL